MNLWLREEALPVVGAGIICGGRLVAMAWLVETGSKPGAVGSANPAPAGDVQQHETPDPRPEVTPPSLTPTVPESVVRSEHRTYALASVAGNDAETFERLQKNCYDAANNNRDGEYPALQQMACARYAQFAESKGWNAGQLPANRSSVDQPAATAIVAQADSVAVGDRQGGSGYCSELIAEKDGINETMRHGYSEPWGTRMRLRLHDIDIALWKNHCPRQ